jgi:hypothetical protein
MANNFPVLDNIETPFSRFSTVDTGTYTINRTYKVDIQDYILRWRGLQKALWGHNLVKLLSKSDTVKDYITLKNTDLSNIASNVTEVFKLEFKRLLNSGLSQSESKTKAGSYSKKYKEMLMAAHEKAYPTDITFENLKQLLVIEKPKQKKETK